MNEPKISIITITFNSEKTLERAIQSVLNQQYSNLEYIIVDGGSSDHTINIIRRYESGIEKWVSEPDGGISDAFNKGIRMASGDIVGIINSDDGLCDGALKEIAKAYSPDIDVYRGKVLLWKEDTGTKVEEIPSMDFTFNGLNNVSHQSTFVAKKAYEAYGMYDKECKYVMDYDLLLRYKCAGAKFKYVDKVLAFYSLGGLTFTKFTAKRRKETERVMKKNGANGVDIICYRIVKYTKLMLQKIVSKEKLMKFRNAKFIGLVRREYR